MITFDNRSFRLRWSRTSRRHLWQEQKMRKLGALRLYRLCWVQKVHCFGTPNSWLNGPGNTETFTLHWKGEARGLKIIIECFSVPFSSFFLFCTYRIKFPYIWSIAASYVRIYGILRAAALHSTIYQGIGIHWNSQSTYGPTRFLYTIPGSQWTIKTIKQWDRSIAIRSSHLSLREHPSTTQEYT